ncbi:MAG TPA: 2-amino-3,7-dideoxy-D-threo-hept-6-ulosonate synthase [Spirochaetia bacterium]|nr:2-amino-3,7-dideoxy-D-threo-hept-6-ulosonate synthase [Spirochaetia bacterium]
MTIGKTVRMRSIFRASTGRTVIVAMDHGSIVGPVKGIERPAEVVAACRAGGADCVLATRGVVQAAGDEWDRGLSFILRLTGGFTVLNRTFEELLISSPETALTYGACGVAVTVKFGHEREGESIRQASGVADACERLGLPLVVEALAKGKGMASNDPAALAVAARAAQELGADLVKTCYTGDPDSFRAVVEGCPAPVVILGGEKSDTLENVFSDVYHSLQAGGKGIAMGRNIWQHERTQAIVEAMVGLVHEDWTIRAAVRHVGP